MARWNARSITPLTLAPFQMVGKGTPPKVINDFRTKRIRAGGGMAEAWRRIGVAVIQMPSPELYGALERGLVDGIVTSHDVTHAFKLYEVANWYATNLDMGVQQAAIAVTIDKWNSLPPQYKKVFDDVAWKAAEAQVETLKKANVAAIEEFKKRGLTAITFDPAEPDTTSFFGPVLSRVPRGEDALRLCLRGRYSRADGGLAVRGLAGRARGLSALGGVFGWRGFRRRV